MSSVIKSDGGRCNICSRPCIFIKVSNITGTSIDGLALQAAVPATIVWYAKRMKSVAKFREMEESVLLLINVDAENAANKRKTEYVSVLHAQMCERVWVGRFIH